MPRNPSYRSLPIIRANSAVRYHPRHVGMKTKARSARIPADCMEAIEMANRWGTPVLAAGMVGLIASIPAIGGYFGATNYSTNSPPTSCAQTHFVAAAEDPSLLPAGYTSSTGMKPPDKSIVVVEEHTPYGGAAKDQLLDAHSLHQLDNAPDGGDRSHLVYETNLKLVTETLDRKS